MKTLKELRFATTSYFLIPLSLQINVGDIWYFKQWQFEISKFALSGCQDIEIIKSEFVGKTQFLYRKFKNFGNLIVLPLKSWPDFASYKLFFCK